MMRSQPSDQHQFCRSAFTQTTPVAASRSGLLYANGDKRLYLAQLRMHIHFAAWATGRIHELSRTALALRVQVMDEK